LNKIEDYETSCKVMDSVADKISSLSLAVPSRESDTYFVTLGNSASSMSNSRMLRDISPSESGPDRALSKKLQILSDTIVLTRKVDRENKQ
jgi:hypothetical protein